MSTTALMPRRSLTVPRAPLSGRVSISSPYDVVRAGLASMTGSVSHQGPGYDVALFDLAHLDTPFLDELRRAIARPTSVVLGLVRPLDPGLGDRALDLGADGCILLGSTGDQLSAAILAARTGRLQGARSLSGASYRLNPVPAAADPIVAKLSLRELETLAWVCRGLSNQEIAQRAFVSENTIKTYIRGSYRKIGVTSRSKAVGWGLQHRVSDHARRRTGYQ